MASQYRQLHPCETDSESISLLVNNSNVSLLFPPDTSMVINLSGALQQALTYCVHLNAELFSCTEGTGGTLNTVEPLLIVAVAWSCVVSTSAAIFFITNWFMCKISKKRRSLKQLGHLNYDVKIGLKPGPRGCKKVGPIGPGWNTGF